MQHKMVEHGADIADRLLNANASIYVCGFVLSFSCPSLRVSLCFFIDHRAHQPLFCLSRDGAGVVKGVNAAVVEILEKFGGLDPTAAKDRHASLLKGPSSPVRRLVTLKVHASDSQWR